MENYIDNIVDDVEKLMEEKGETIALRALYDLINKVDERDSVPSRPKTADAKAFVENALGKDWYTDETVKAFGGWCGLDAKTYCTAAKMEQDEIIRRVVNATAATILPCREK